MTDRQNVEAHDATCWSSSVCTAEQSPGESSNSESLHQRRGAPPKRKRKDSWASYHHSQNGQQPHTTSFSAPPLPRQVSNFRPNANPLYPFYPREQLRPSASFSSVTPMPNSTPSDEEMCAAAASGIIVNAHLLRLTESVLSNDNGLLDLGRVMLIVDEVSNGPAVNSSQVVYSIATSFMSRNPAKLLLTLELVEMCVKNCGLSFASRIDERMMTAMERLLKISSFKQKTLAGRMNKALQKYITGEESGVATDLRVHTIREKVLSLIQLWADSFMLEQGSVSAIYGCYRKLRSKGVYFPRRGPGQKYLVKDTEDSPAFELSSVERCGRLQGSNHREQVNKNWSREKPLDESLRKIERIIWKLGEVQESAKEKEHMEKVLSKGDKANLFLERKLRGLNNDLQSTRQEDRAQTLLGTITTILQQQERLEKLLEDVKQKAVQCNTSSGELAEDTSEVVVGDFSDAADDLPPAPKPVTTVCSNRNLLLFDEDSFSIDEEDGEKDTARDPQPETSCQFEEVDEFLKNTGQRDLQQTIDVSKDACNAVLEPDCRVESTAVETTVVQTEMQRDTASNPEVLIEGLTQQTEAWDSTKHCDAPVKSHQSVMEEDDPFAELWKPNKMA